MLREAGELKKSLEIEILAWTMRGTGKCVHRYLANICMFEIAYEFIIKQQCNGTCIQECMYNNSMTTYEKTDFTEKLCLD